MDELMDELRLEATIEKLGGTFALINKPAPDGIIILEWARRLISAFSDQQIAVALDRMLREVEWVTFKAIIERVPDGRPEPEEAWALCPKTEEASIVWTDEMATAFGVARSLLLDGNPIAARMAFLEKYESEVTAARLELRPVSWRTSLGSDKTDRIRALAEAVAAGRIPAEHALSLVGEQADALRLALPEIERKRMLLEGDAEIAHLPQHLRGLAALRDALPKSLTETKRPARIEMTDEQRAEHRKRVREQASAIARRAEEERQGAIADKLFTDPPLPPIPRRRPHRRRQIG